MPELPEVETVRRGLQPVLEGRRIVSAEVRRVGLRIPFPKGLAGWLTGKRVSNIRRRAKYLIFAFDDVDEVLLVHLGMSGRMVVSGPGGANQMPDSDPHDHVVMDEPIRIRHLSGNLLHYSYPTIRDHISQINSFSDIAARAAFEKGRQSNLALDICLNPTLTFFKKYFLKLGLFDGYEGFVISISTAYGKFLKYVKLRELERQRDSDDR